MDRSGKGTPQRDTGCDPEPTGTAWMRRTRIVATLGPASFDRIEELVNAGASIFRLNFSHGDHAVLTKVIAAIKEIREQRDLAIGILGDLCGPKIRVGRIGTDDGTIRLVDGETINLKYSESELGSATTIVTDVAAVVSHLQPEQSVLLEDGKMKIIMQKRISSVEVRCLIVQGGILLPKKGINVPDLALALSALTEKDKNDAAFICQHRLDFIALSFVQRQSDLLELRRHLGECLEDPADFPWIIAKIEKPQAVEAIDSILEVADGIMVARGDLGVECSLEVVPRLQKELIAKCNQLGKPVITATQMLESMIHEATPTRAEVSDVANAILDGSDAVMLSGESAAGDYPVASVQQMSRICGEAEKMLWDEKTRRNFRVESSALPKSPAMSVVFSAIVAAETCNAAGLIVFTQSGMMVCRMRSCDYRTPVFVVTISEALRRRISLYRGVTAVALVQHIETDQCLYLCEKEAISRGIFVEGQQIVFCTGTHDRLLGLSNTIRVSCVGEASRYARMQDLWSKAANHARRTNSEQSSISSSQQSLH